VLELKDIHKSFKQNGNVIQVLNGINMKVNPGESVAIMGASGVGKSTLLNVMGTLEPPTHGEVFLGGNNLYAMRESELNRLRNRKIGFVFQFHHLLPEFNAIENTIMPALIARINKDEAEETARDILSKVGLQNRLNHRIGELSGGEQQRVAIARALIMKPRLLLADEPTGNLDRVTGGEVIDLLLRLREESDLGMVIATHNQKFAEKMSRLMEIVDGRIQ